MLTITYAIDLDTGQVFSRVEGHPTAGNLKIAVCVSYMRGAWRSSGGLTDQALSRTSSSSGTGASRGADAAAWTTRPMRGAEKACCAMWGSGRGRG
jgi:hypothetical protein